MSQSGFTPIQLYRSSTAATLPVAGNLAPGELAINTTDEKLYFENTGGTVTLLASSAAAGGTFTTVTATTVVNGLGAVGTPSYTFTGDLNTGMWSPAADTIAFSEGGVEAMRISNAGDVGIGNSAPSARLSVTPTATPTSATGTLQIATGEQGNNGIYQLRMGYILDSTYKSVINSISGGVGADLLLNPSGGSVGIATTTPSRTGGATSATNLLSVYGSLTLPYQVTGAEPFRMGDFATTNFTAGSASIGSAVGLTFSNWNAAGSGNTVIQAGVDAGNGGITLQARRTAVGVVSNMADFGIDTTTFSTGNTERFRITSAGLVGIGTTAPTKMLSVHQNQGGLRLNHDFALADYSEISVNAGGLTGTSAMIRSYRAAADGYGNEGDLRFYTNYGTVSAATEAGEVVRIDRAGNVGINTTTPAEKLDVVGAAFVHSDSPTGIASLTLQNDSTAANTTKSLTLEFRGKDTVGTVKSTGFIKSIPNDQDHVNDSMVFGTRGTDASAERMRIDNAGVLRVNETTNGFTSSLKLSVTGAATEGAFLFKNSAGNGQWTGWVWNSATSGDNLFIQFLTEAGGTGRGSIIYNRGAGLLAFNTTSDYRAKDILGPVTDAGATIDAIKVHNGKMKGATVARPMLVAHEAQEVVPYAVMGEKDALNKDGTAKYQQMDHQSLVPLLIAEVQSLRARVAQLEGNQP